MYSTVMQYHLLGIFRPAPVMMTALTLNRLETASNLERLPRIQMNLQAVHPADTLNLTRNDVYVYG